MLRKRTNPDQDGRYRRDDSRCAKSAKTRAGIRSAAKQLYRVFTGRDLRALSTGMRRWLRSVICSVTARSR